MVKTTKYSSKLIEYTMQTFKKNTEYWRATINNNCQNIYFLFRIYIRGVYW